jgi:hypothetical protein
MRETKFLSLQIYFVCDFMSYEKESVIYKSLLLIKVTWRGEEANRICFFY